MRGTLILSWHGVITDKHKLLFMTPSDFDSVKQPIQSCVQDLHSWTDSNKLKRIADKTDVMTVGTTTCPKQVHTQSVVIIDSDIPFKLTRLCPCITTLVKYAKSVVCTLDA